MKATIFLFSAIMFLHCNYLPAGTEVENALQNERTFSQSHQQLSKPHLDDFSQPKNFAVACINDGAGHCLLGTEDVLLNLFRGSEALDQLTLQIAPSSTQELYPGYTIVVYGDSNVKAKVSVQRRNGDGELKITVDPLDQHVEINGFKGFRGELNMEKMATVLYKATEIDTNHSYTQVVLVRVEPVDEFSL